MAGSLWHHRRKGSGSGSLAAPPTIDDHGRIGCMPNILQFLGPLQRHRARKMLTYHKHGIGKGKTPKSEEIVASTSENHEHLDKDTSLSVKSKDDAVIKTAPTSPVGATTEKGKSKNGHKREGSRFSRTFSIHHHLENNGYVLPDELTSDNENPMAEVGLNENDSNWCQNVADVSERQTTTEQYEEGERMEKMSEIDREQLHEFTDRLAEKKLPTQELSPDTEESLSKLKTENSREVNRDPTVDHPKEFLDMMELLNTNKDLFLKIIRDPVFAKYVQSQQASSSAAAFEKSVSFPAPRMCNGDLWTQNLDGRMERNQIVLEERERSQHQQSSSTAERLEGDGQGMELSISSDDNILRSEAAPSDPPEPRFEALKNPKNMSNASKHFKGLRQKMKDIIKANNQENRRISMDGVLHKIPHGQKISENAKKEVSGRWQGTLVRIGSLSSNNNNYKLRSMKRSSSLAESLDRYSHLFENSSNREIKRSPDTSTLKEENSELQSKNKSRTLERTVSLPDLHVKSETCDSANSVISSSVNEESGVNVSGNEKALESGQKMELLIDEGVKGTAEGAEEQHILTDEQEELETCKRSDASTPERIRYSCLREDIDDIPVVSNSTNEAHNQEGSLDPVQIASAQAETAFDPLQGELEELEFSDAPPPSEENIDDDFYDEPSPEKLDDVNTLPMHADEKDQAEFHYVKNILSRSGFSTQYALGEWYSVDQPMDPLLFEEAECSTDELNVAEISIDTTIYHMLLFDLINEVLLQIYDASSSRISWVSYVDHIRRPLPVGSQVLEEVWAVIRQYIGSQTEDDPVIERIVARDFMKSDGWMNLRHDTKIVELQLEDLILDDLIDEVLGFSNLSTWK